MSTFKARGYQNDMIAETRVALRQHNAVLLNAPTGAGKTRLAAMMLGTAASKGVRSTFIVHRQELIEQSSAAFHEVGIEHGIIAAGWTPKPWAPVQVASIQTLKQRIDRLAVPGLVIWDESHHVAAKGWATTFAHYALAKHVGLTATPCRLDGRGLGEWFQTMVRGPSVRWLIDNKYLAPFKVYAPNVPGLEGVRVRGGEFATADAAGAMDKGSITGDAVRHYQTLAAGKAGIAFCCSVAHSQHVAEQFRAAGIVAVHLDGEMDKAERQRIMRSFRNREIQVLTNVDLFGEGVDVPGVEVVQMLRPTMSLSLYLQQAGRACRPVYAPGYDLDTLAGRILAIHNGGKPHALILDHAGNVLRHGFPDDDREWSLDGDEQQGRRKKEADPEGSVRLCPACFGVHRPAPRCPHCGHVYIVEEKIPETADGDLVELDPEVIRAKRKAEEGKARTIDDLVRLATERGYKNPEKWAAMRFTGRQIARQKFTGSRRGNDLEWYERQGFLR